MLLTSNEHEDMKIFEEFLQEKLIMFNRGQRYGQVVFLAGGAGSGKGFAISNFMEADKFKIRDVDEWKKALIKLDDIASKVGRVARQKGIDTKKIFGVAARNLNLSKASDVFALHKMVRSLGWKERTLDLLLGDKTDASTLPNIIFDTTGKDLSDISDMLQKLTSVGYSPNNIHVTWILTNYKLAMKRNTSRERVVPEDIMLQTHRGAAQTMTRLVQGNIPRGINGAVNVVLNNQENTIFWTDRQGRTIRTSRGNPVVKDFTYVNVKKEGRPFVKEKAVQNQIWAWIKSNVPDEAMKQPGVKRPVL